MKIKITCAAVLAFAGAAGAAPFSVTGLVDFGGPGNAGAPLTVTGGIVAYTPGVLNYQGPGTTGAAVAPDADGPSFPNFTAGSEFTISGFEGGYFADAPVMSGIAPDGRDGVFLMNLRGDYATINITDVNVEINDEVINFSDFGVAGNGGSANYELQIYQPFGRVLGDSQIWVVFIPTPASAGLIGLAGFAALRRRR